MKKIILLLLIFNSFLTEAQKREVPPKPENLTFSHFIKIKLNKENGKIIYLRKSNNRPLHSNEPFNITETYINEKTDIRGVNTHTPYNKIGYLFNGYKNGLWKTTYKNKLIKTENWNNGLILGKYKVNTIEGTLIYRTDFGKEGNGKYKDYYYETGILKQEGNYENGKKEGEWCDYDKQGNLITTTYYKRGVQLKK